MTEPNEDPIAEKLLEAVLNAPDDDEALQANRIKNLKNYSEAKKLLTPEPEPVPEPTGFRAFLNKNSGDLIKAGSTLIVVSAIAVFETRGDVIFRSKATKYL